MDKRLTVSDVARELTVRHGVVVSPKTLTDLFYRRELDDIYCPIIGGRRLIPLDFLPTLERVLRRHGHLPGDEPR
jgi:hypothetical protein